MEGIVGRAWTPAPPELFLSVGDVHVWRLTLDQNVRHCQQSMTLLCRTERERAERFHFRADRDRFVVSRSVLRILLGRYLGCTPGDVCFGYSDHGKPLVLTHEGAPAIQFNVSHSGDYTLYAFAPDREVGIDVERIRALMDFDVITARVFGWAERDLIARAPEDEKVALFFQLWCRKEAYVKALGHGLSTPLHEFSVLANSIETPGRDGRMHKEPRRYVHDLQCTRSYTAALATDGQPNRVTLWQWNEPTV
jgi:4'-phosphopantetheinyl transferase